MQVSVQNEIKQLKGCIKKVEKKGGWISWWMTKKRWRRRKRNRGMSCKRTFYQLRIKFEHCKQNYACKQYTSSSWWRNEAWRFKSRGKIRVFVHPHLYHYSELTFLVETGQVQSSNKKGAAFLVHFTEDFGNNEKLMKANGKTEMSKVNKPRTCSDNVVKFDVRYI